MATTTINGVTYQTVSVTGVCPFCGLAWQYTSCVGPIVPPGVLTHDPPECDGYATTGRDVYLAMMGVDDGGVDP
jgi:hypothetical protein